MKKLLLSIILLVTIISAMAQNVGIGTTNPNNSALLDLNSTTRGLLLPRLNNTQMFAIDNPASGLVVFNTNYNQLYHYNGTAWRSLLNSDYWIRPLNNRDVMGNSTDSVGIGITVPTRRLDVNGTMRVRGTLFADGSISAEGLLVSGNFLANTGVVNGSLQTNEQVVINNASAIVQLSASGENKGFMQLNGNDLRIGTNSGNDDGKFVIRTNGADRVSVDEAGVLNITNKITSSSTGSASLTPLCWGRTNSALGGGIRRGTANTSMQRLARGQYRLSCPGITENSCAVFSPAATGITIGHICNEGYIDIYIRTSDTGEDFDQGFSFVVY
jgi:trimeric autotransporter adhesin